LRDRDTLFVSLLDMALLEKDRLFLGNDRSKQSGCRTGNGTIDKPHSIH
jgi:hypothetical protein